MRNIHISLAVTVLIVALLSLGCSSKSGNVYSPSQAQTEHTVTYGTITDVKPITIQGEQSGLGILGGGIIGGVLGSTMGHGTGNTLAILGGAVLGGAAGAAGEHAVKTKDGLELTVQQDDGKIVSIVQEAGDEVFSTGDKVRILRASDGSARVRK